MLYVEIYTPEKTVFKGDAQSVKMPGNSGSFEILKDHAPLITSLEVGELRITDEKNKQTFFEIQGGFAEVLNNRVSVLIEGLNK